VEEDIMIDVTDTATLIQRLAGIDLTELRQLHNCIQDAEEITRALIRQREAQERRNQRLRERGLAIVSEG
jgi:hypothetical protein